MEKELEDSLYREQVDGARSPPSPGGSDQWPEMVERVAAALEDAMASDDNHPEDLARAAIQAMREPIKAMIAAVSNGAESWNIRIARDYRAMIDAALSNHEGVAG